MIPLPIIAAIVGLLAGFAAGYGFEHRARVAEVAQIRADIARREAAAAEEARRRIEAAHKAANQALAAREARIAELDTITRRLRHDLKTATTGRPCLPADARELLHQSPAFGTRMPETSGGVATAPAAAASNPGERAESTDADIAGWILEAAALYEQCRARIDALRQWDEMSYVK